MILEHHHQLMGQSDYQCSLKIQYASGLYAYKGYHCVVDAALSRYFAEFPGSFTMLEGGDAQG